MKIKIINKGSINFYDHGPSQQAVVYDVAQMKMQMESLINALKTSSIISDPGFTKYIDEQEEEENESTD